MFGVFKISFIAMLLACTLLSGCTDVETKDTDTTNTNAVQEVEKEDTIVELEEPKKPEMPLGHQMALKQAESYIKYSSFSKKGLYNQLTYEGEGYSDEEAQYAVENVEADWKAEALEAGKKLCKIL